MEDDFGLTQDCVEWSDDPAAINLTPTNQKATSKDYSPNQEIEELWKLLGTPSQTPGQSLQHSRPITLPPKRPQNSIRPMVEQRKRKRPLSSDSWSNRFGDGHQNDAEILHKSSLSLGFEELLQRLDNSRDSSPKKAQLISENLVASSLKSKDDSSLPINSLMPPPQRDTSARTQIPSIQPKRGKIGIIGDPHLFPNGSCKSIISERLTNDSFNTKEYERNITSRHAFTSEPSLEYSLHQSKDSNALLHLHTKHIGSQAAEPPSSETPIPGAQQEKFMDLADKNNPSAFLTRVTERKVVPVKCADDPTKRLSDSVANSNRINQAQNAERVVITPIGQSMVNNVFSHPNVESKSLPSTTSTDQSKATEFDDDFDFSEADIAALDAVVVTQAKRSDSKGNSDSVSKSDIVSLKDISDNVIIPSTTKFDCTSFENDNDDEFGEFNINFNDLDIIVQQKINGETAKTTKESFSDPFGEAFDFSQIDKTIAERKDQANIEFPKHTRNKDLRSLLIPPFDVKVANALDPQYDESLSVIAFSRFCVVSVVDDINSYTKAILVKSWTKESHHNKENRQHYYHTISRNILRNSSKEKEFGDGWIFLRGEWYHTQVEAQDVIHLCSLSGRYKTDQTALPVILHTNAPQGSDPNDDLFLILHPDTLVTPTIVSETITCSRRAILRWKIGSTGISNSAALYGTMRHRLFEECLHHDSFSREFAEVRVLKIVRQNAENLLALGIKDNEAKREVLRVLPQILVFKANFIDTRNRPFSQANTIDGNGVNPSKKFVVRSVESIEEALISQELGLKGNLDVTIEAMTQDVPSLTVPNPSVPETSRIAIELKTGSNQNPQNVHMAQLALYTLLLSIRYGQMPTQSQNASKTGVLLYMNHESIRAIRVSPMIQELKSLIGQRNVIASEMKKASAPRGIKVYEGDMENDDISQLIVEPAPCTSLPSVLGSSQPCNRCYANRECMLYAAADESKNSGQQVKKSHAKLISHFCSHLDDDDFNYFLEWDRLIDIEADATAKYIATSWLTSSLDLERSSGKTVSSLLLDDCLTSPQLDETGSEWFPITLTRSKDSESKSFFTNLAIESGCHVVISADFTSFPPKSNPRRYRSNMHLARGIVQSVHESKIVVRVSSEDSRQLRKELEAVTMQRRILKLRIDRDDVQTGLGTTRLNLINLFTGDAKPLDQSKADPRLLRHCTSRNRYQWLRNVLVKLHPPQFDRLLCNSMFCTTEKCDIPGCSIEELKFEFSLLNCDQKEAVMQIFSAKDYSLVQGLPGTGKSTIIVFVARLFVAHGKRVLITSYTHAAVDNIMMKLMEKGLSKISKSDCRPKLLRIGVKSSSHPAVHPILLSAVATSFQKRLDSSSCHMPSSESLQATLLRARIVGITALSIPRSPVLMNQDFDVVIVDEAGQISQPVIIGALSAANSFILVGDHMQLPPLVQSHVAERAGFGVSMLSRLAEKHPTCVAQLKLQYRMHASICQLCNDIVYGGKLKCANDAVMLELLQLSKFRNSDTWVCRIIDPNKPVVFANTDYFECQDGDSRQVIVGLERRPEKNDRGNMVNDREVSIVRRVIEELVISGLSPSLIGVISPFRAQVRMFNDSEPFSRWKSCGLEISTIDRYQGRDKQVIILSLVRSNTKGFSGRLLNDFRRLNVAVSRAKKKLILVGSYFTLHNGSDVLRPLLDNFELRNQIERIPEYILRSQLS
jgi:DNA replication ATP-dependent helicase Dna2